MAGKAPQSQLLEISPAKIKATVHDIKQLYDLGRPETDEELEQRIDMFFQFCENSSIRPAVSALCTALHISRTTLFRWSRGEDCSKKRQEIIEMAKSFIDAFLEQATMSGQVQCAVGIFLMKNWLGYKDTISIEEAMGTTVKTAPARTPEEIAAGYGITVQSEFPELPPVPED